MKPHLLVFGLLVALAVWLFGPALSGGASFAFRDAAHFYHPLFEYIRDQWGAGRLPLWDPCENLGVPLVAEATSSIFYPGKLLFALPLDYTLLYNFYIAGHVVLAGVTAFRLSRHWSTSVLGSGAAALAYAFNGNVLFQYCNVVFLVGAAWLPWAVQLADRMLRQRSPSAAIGFGAVLALMITGGDPHMAYNAGLLACLCALILFRAAPQVSHATASPSTPSNSPTSGRMSRLAVHGLLLALAATAAGLLAAVQILPSMEASRFSARESYNAPRNVFELAQYLVGGEELDERVEWYDGFLGRDPDGHQADIYQFSIEPWRSIEFVWPNITGQPFPKNHRWMAELGAEGNLWTPSHYLGLLPLLLAARTWSLRRRAPAEVRWLSWMVVLGALASFGMYGVAWLVGLVFGGSDLLRIGGEVGGLHWWMVTLLPSYVSFRYSGKFFVVATLGLCILAGRGWDQAWQSGGLRLRRWLYTLSATSFVALCALAGLWSFLRYLTDSTRAGGALVGPFDPQGAGRDAAFALAQTTVLALVVLGTFALYRTRRRYRPWLPTAALVVIALDLAFAQRHLVLFAPAADWRDTPPIVRQLPPDHDHYRVYRQLGPLAPSFALKASDERYTECLRWDRATLWPKYPLPYDISLVESTGTMISHDFQLLVDVAKTQSYRERTGNIVHSSVLDLLGARVAILADDLKFDRKSLLATPAEGMVAINRPAALPRAWIVHQVEVLSELPSRATRPLKKRTEAMLFPDNQPRDWRHTAVVETNEPLASPMEPLNTGAEEHCTLLSAEPMAITLDVHLASAGLVVLSDTYFPGWELTDEIECQSHHVPIVRTNRVMRGAVLAAGDHHLVYRYRPLRLYWGGALSGLSAAAMAIALLVRGLGRWRRGQTRLPRPHQI